MPLTLDPFDKPADVVDLHSRAESQIVRLHDERLRADFTVEPCAQGCVYHLLERLPGMAGLALEPRDHIVVESQSRSL